MKQDKSTELSLTATGPSVILKADAEPIRSLVLHAAGPFGAVWEYFRKRFEIAANAELAEFEAQNLMEVQKKVIQLAADGGVDPASLRPIPDSFLFRALDAIKKQDDKTIQTMWARLILNASVESNNFRWTRSPLMRQPNLR